MSDRLLRIRDIIGCPKRGIPPLIPVSRTAFYAGVKDGRFPQPTMHFSKRSVFWRESDVHEFLKNLK